MDAVLGIVSKINSYLSDYILIILLVGVGLFFTIKTRFVQVRCFGEGMKKVFGNVSHKGGKQKSGLTSFQALATAIAAQVGTGNISVLLPERFGFSLAPSAPDCTGFSRVDLRVRSFFGIPSVSLIGNDYII